MQKVSTYLWFDTNAEEAMNFYTSLFSRTVGSNSDGDKTKIVSIERYPTDMQIGPVPNMSGKVIHGVFSLAGQTFMCLDGGPYFSFTPAISLSVACSTEEEVDTLWQALSTGGVLMELQEYPFSKKYGWCKDKYGLTWQLSLAESDQKITPSLLFTKDKAGKVEDALTFYTSVFSKTGDSKINMVSHYEDGPDKGKVNYSNFTLAGQQLTAMESSLQHDFTFNEAVSLYVECEDQAELDYFWEKLSAVPEAEQCGWCKDRYGVSWQIVPKKLDELMSSSDQEKKQRLMQAIMPMKKLDIAELEKAYNGS